MCVSMCRDVHRRGLRLLGQLRVCPPRLKIYIYFLNSITAAEFHVGLDKTCLHHRQSSSIIPTSHNPTQSSSHYELRKFETKVSRQPCSIFSMTTNAHRVVILPLLDSLRAREPIIGLDIELMGKHIGAGRSQAGGLMRRLFPTKVHRCWAEIRAPTGLEI